MKILLRREKINTCPCCFQARSYSCRTHLKTVLSVCLQASNNLIPDETIFMKFSIGKSDRELRMFLLIYFQRGATVHSSFISGKLLYVFRVVSPLIMKSTYNCINSIWCLLTVTATCFYCGRFGAGLRVVWELRMCSKSG